LEKRNRAILREKRDADRDRCDDALSGVDTVEKDER
jgi:hypothetical protein